MMHAKTEHPVISIVIANYNYGRFLETAIKSVVEQDGFEKCELLIIDGGSTDNSVDVIGKFADKIAYWVSEKDNGQSDAFNKGFAKARGRIGCWVNADDILLPGTLNSVLQVLKKYSDAEWITGGTIFFDDQMRIWKARIGTGLTRWMYRWVDPTVIGGPSSFFSLSRLREVGGFNVGLHYTMDCDLWNKFFAAGMRIHHLKRYLWGFRMHPASKTAHALVGPKDSEFNAEDEVVFSRRGFSAKQKRLATRMLRCVKLLNGSLFRSFYDTKRWRNDSILTFKQERPAGT